MSKFIEIEVDQTSIKAVEKSLKEYGVEAAKALMTAIYRTAVEIEQKAVLRLSGFEGSAKHWITGRLASSVHAEAKSANSFVEIADSEPGDGKFGLPLGELEAFVGTNVEYSQKIEDIDPYIGYATVKEGSKLGKWVTEELNKLATKFNK